MNRESHLSEARKEWEDYKKKFNKKYPVEDEDLRRMGLYFETKKFVEEHNAKYKNGEVSSSVGINEFADKDPEESQSCYFVPGKSHN